MKYRIENGEVKMPISELNKVNDQVAEFEAREEKIQAIENKLLKNSVATELYFSSQTDYMGIGMRSHIYYNEIITEKYTDLDGVLKKAVEAEKKRMQFYVDEKNEKLEKLQKKLDNARRMSIRQFLKWRY